MASWTWVGHKSNVPKWNICSAHNSTPQQVKKLLSICLYIYIKDSVLIWSSLESWGVKLWNNTLFVIIACELARQQHHQCGKVNTVIIFKVVLPHDDHSFHFIDFDGWRVDWSALKILNLGTFGLWPNHIHGVVSSLRSILSQLMRCRCKGKHMSFPMIWHLIHRIYHVFQKITNYKSFVRSLDWNWKINHSCMSTLNLSYQFLYCCLVKVSIAC